MQYDAISENLCEFIRNSLVAEGVSVNPDTSLQQLGLDSFSIIEIVLFIERKFGLTLPDEALTQENIRTPGSLAKCVQQYLQESR